MTGFYLDKRTDKHGDCPIRVSARAAGGRLLTSIGYSIAPAKWDSASQQVKPGTEKNPVTNAKGIPAATINARIAAIKAAFARLEATPGAATIEAFQAELDALTGKAEKAAAKGRPAQLPKSIVITYFELFLREESARSQWAPATLAKMRSFQNSLEEYNSGLTFADFNESGIDGYINHLRKQGHEETSIQKRYSNLKWFLAWAIRKGYCSETAIQTYRPKFKVLAKPVIFLTRPELLKLYNYQIPANQTKVTLKDSAGREYEKTIEEAGATKAINNIPSFYGLKNDYKYLGAISENMLLSANADYSQSLFINNNVDGSLMNLDSTSGLTHIATGPAGSGWLYSKNYTMKNLAFFPGIELGASASTYYCDGYYNPHINSGLRAAYLLGYANVGGNAGSLYLHGDRAVSGAYANLGAFLCEWAEAFTTEPFWCQES